MFVYRENGKLKFGNSEEFNNMLGIHINDNSIHDECSYILDDDGKIDMNFLNEIKNNIFKVNLTELKKLLNRYIERWGYSPEEKEAILNKYSSLIIFCGGETPKSHCRVEV